MKQISTIKINGVPYTIKDSTIPDFIREASPEDLSGVGIESIEVQESSASGGNNIVTITTTDGNTTSFTIKNGTDGDDGVDGEPGPSGVSLGEVELVQTTGNNDSSVMSQKAVTEYGKKINSIEDTRGISPAIREVLTSLGWTFDVMVNLNRTTTSDTSSCASPYIPIDYDLNGHNIDVIHNNIGSSLRFCVFVDTDKSNTLYYIVLNETNNKIGTVTSGNIAYIRCTFSKDNLYYCAIYDHTAKKYIFKFDEYLYNILKEYNTSYNYIGDIEVLKHTFDKPSYFRGTLCDFKLSEFPNLDLRSGDGISIVFDGRMAVSSTRSAFLEIYDSTYKVASSTYFAIAQDYRTLRAGLLTNYYMTTVMGANVLTDYLYTYYVITFDFNDGTLISYSNGVEQHRVTPNDYNKSQLMAYLNNATGFRMGHFSSDQQECMTGMAVFPRVITADEVATLYGVGAESTTGQLLPDYYQANLLHPQFLNGDDLGVYIQDNSMTRTTDGNKVVLTKSGTGTATFGFTGISGTINNHIYEWDMHIVSGSWTPNHNGATRRIMRYNNNYYNVVFIYDENGVEVTDNILTEGNYHVVCTPDNILARHINAVTYQLIYIFSDIEDGSVIEITNFKVVERGAALVCSINNYKGEYFLQKNGDKVPKCIVNNIYNNDKCLDYYDTYKASVVPYSSSTKVQYTGQLAVDKTNSRMYVGIITGAKTYVWKQINNS